MKNHTLLSALFILAVVLILGAGAAAEVVVNHNERLPVLHRPCTPIQYQGSAYMPERCKQ